MQKDEKYVQGLVKPGKRENRKSGRRCFKKYICAGNLYIYQLLFFPAVISGSKYYYRIYSGGSDNGYMDFKESIQSCQFRYQRPAL